MLKVNLCIFFFFFFEGFLFYCLFKISVCHLLQQTKVVTPRVVVHKLKYEGGDWGGWRLLSSHACLPLLARHPFLMNGLSPLALHSKQGNRQKREKEWERERWLSLLPYLSRSPLSSLKPVGRSEAEPQRPAAASPCCANKSPFHFN